MNSSNKHFYLNFSLRHGTKHTEKLYLMRIHIAGICAIYASIYTEHRLMDIYVIIVHFSLLVNTDTITK